MRNRTNSPYLAIGVALGLMLLALLAVYLVSARPNALPAPNAAEQIAIAARTAPAPRSPGAALPASPSADLDDAAAPAQPAGPKIRVGVILSAFNATGPSWVSKPAGYTRQVSFLREMKDPALEIVPLCDPAPQGGHAPHRRPNRGATLGPTAPKTAKRGNRPAA